MSRTYISSDGIKVNPLQKNENYLLDNYIAQSKSIPVGIFGDNKASAIFDGINYLISAGGGRIFVPADNNHSELEIRIHKDRSGIYHTNFEYYYDRYPTTEARPYTDEDWQVGDTIFNSQPNIDKCTGWVCTTPGTPGSWIPFGYTKRWFSEVEVVDSLPDPNELQLGRQLIVRGSDDSNKMYYCIYKNGSYQWIEKLLNGKSAYELAQDNGYTGTESEWLDSLDITVTSTSITYQQGDNGTTPPSSTWTSDIPQIDSGKYLWSRQIINFSDNSSITVYGVSRNGITPVISATPNTTGYSITIQNGDDHKEIQINHGNTPQKGVDYWNDADKQEINSYIDTKISEITPKRGVNYWTEEDIAAIHAYIDEQIAATNSGSTT